MISPHTPPGTRVVCVDAEGALQLVEGGTYTLSKITRDGNDFFAEIEGPYSYEQNGWFLSRFRRLDLPESLTRLLHAAPVKERV